MVAEGKKGWLHLLSIFTLLAVNIKYQIITITIIITLTRPSIEDPYKPHST